MDQNPTANTSSNDPIGGQALIDGVMIRQSDRWAGAVRRSDGSIATTHVVAPLALRSLRGVPFVRGMGALVDSLRIGMSAMRWSRSESQSGLSDTGEAQESDGLKEHLVVLLVVSVVLGAFLLVPLGVAGLASPVIGHGVGLAFTEGLVRLAMFVGYLAMLSKLKGVQTTLEYHGAEHMVVAAHECGEDDSIESIRKHSVRHPRCGTDFFLLIFAVSIVVFAVLGGLSTLWLITSRVALAPVIVGVSYEILRAGGDHHSPFARALAKPGLMLQRFTTREPTDDQIEVARAALGRLLKTSALTDR